MRCPLYQGIDTFQVKGIFLVGIIVILPATASVIYEIENRSLLKQSIAHFVRKNYLNRTGENRQMKRLKQRYGKYINLSM